MCITGRTGECAIVKGKNVIPIKNTGSYRTHIAGDHR